MTESTPERREETTRVYTEETTAVEPRPEPNPPNGQDDVTDDDASAEDMQGRRPGDAGHVGTYGDQDGDEDGRG